MYFTEKELTSTKGRTGILGISSQTLRRMIKKGEFPAPIRLSSRRIGFDQRAVERWLNERPTATREV